MSLLALRHFVSAADTVFYLAAAWCAWRIESREIRADALGIALVVGTLLLDHAVELWKFGRIASYHAWTAKLWGLALFAALALLFASGSGALLPAAIACGLLSHLENLAITAVLPTWQHDVPSVVHAWRLRGLDSAAEGR